MEDLRERYGDYPMWAAIQRAYNLGVDGGFDAAAKTPSVWYVKDHGEVFYLGDRVWFGGFEQEINGFVRAVDDTTTGIRLNVSGLVVDPSEISHEKPDTWEKLQHDVIESIFRAADASESVELGRAFVSRAKKLGGCDE